MPRIGYLCVEGLLRVGARVLVASRKAVACVPGQAFFADGSGANTLRLNFSQPDVTAIKEGIFRLSRLVKKVLAGG